MPGAPLLTPWQPSPLLDGITPSFEAIGHDPSDGNGHARPIGSIVRTSIGGLTFYWRKWGPAKTNWAPIVRGVDTVTAGTGISVTTVDGEATIDNVGITALAAGPGISLVELAPGVYEIQSTATDTDPFELVDQRDEFIAPETGNFGARVGQLQWGVTVGGGGSLNNYEIVGEANHLGIFGLRTSAGIGHNVRMHRGSIATTVFMVATDLDYTDFLFQIPDVSDIVVRVGIGRDLSSSTFGTHGAWIELDTGSSANFRTFTREASSTSSPTDTGVTPANGEWHRFRVGLEAGDIIFKIDDVTVGTHATDVPTGIVTTGIYVESRAAATREVRVDFHRFRSIELGARY